MSDETIEAKMARVLAALVSGDEAALEELCDPDFCIEQAAGLPYGGSYNGIAGKSEMSKRLRATLSDISISTEHVLSDATGDHVIMMQRLRARSSQTGRLIDMSVAELFSFRDGRLISIRPHYWDTKAISDACQNN